MFTNSASPRWALAILCVLLVLHSRWPPVGANPGPEQAVTMTEALKYLQALDKYYSQVARPRFGRSLPLRSPEMDMSAEAEADKFYSQRRR